MATQMNREDIIRMAMEAGGTVMACYSPDLIHFAALVAAAEREECAKVCEEVDANPHVVLHHAVVCAAAIRARR